MTTQKFFVGTAGWTLPKPFAHRFEEKAAGSHLERYARKLSGVEINSAFYKPHKPETYERWAQSVPADFRFSVKLEKVYTHERKLTDASGLGETIAGLQHLGEKLGALLVQLPPKLQFESEDVESFFTALRDVYDGVVVIEPRHESWRLERALRVLEDYSINKVLADPEPCFVERARRARVTRVAYYRLHGTPEMYRSNYESARLDRIATAVMRDREEGRDVWCMFDNTTFGFATDNALDLLERVL